MTAIFHKNRMVFKQSCTLCHRKWAANESLIVNHKLLYHTKKMISTQFWYCFGIAEVMGSNSVQFWIFFRPYFFYCLNKQIKKTTVYIIICFSYIHSQRKHIIISMLTPLEGLFSSLQIIFTHTDNSNFKNCSDILLFTRIIHRPIVYTRLVNMSGRNA